MKKLLFFAKLTFMIIFSCFATLSVKAQQAYPCDSFCVENIKMDSADNTQMQVVLYNSSSMFIDYPTLRVVGHGDTIGNKSGSVEYYGQLGKTTLTYTMSSSVKTIPAKCTVILTSPTGGATCYLPYPCSTSTSVQKATKPAYSFSIFPDPVSSILSIEPGEAKDGAVRVRIYSLTGKELINEYFPGISKLFSINVGQLPAGMYLISVNGNNSSFKGKFIRE